MVHDFIPVLIVCSSNFQLSQFFLVFSFSSRISLTTNFYPIAVSGFFCGSLVFHCCNLARCFWSMLVLYVYTSLLLLLLPLKKVLWLFKNCLRCLPFSPATFHRCSNVILSVHSLSVHSTQTCTKDAVLLKI